MDLQNALKQAGLAEQAEVEIPTKWNKCEIHGIGGDIEDSLLFPLSQGVVGVSCFSCPDGGEYIISPREIINKPDQYGSKFKEILQAIQRAHPRCEILWF